MFAKLKSTPKPFALPWVTFIISSLLLVAYGFMGVVLQSGSTSVKDSELLDLGKCTAADLKGLPEELISTEDGCLSALTAFVSVDEIDPNARNIDVYLRLYPEGDLGTTLPNGGYFNSSITVRHTGSGTSEWNIPSNEWVGGHKFSVPMSNAKALNDYPFDTYKGDVTMYAGQDVSGEWLPLSLAASKHFVQGYDLKLNRVVLDTDIKGEKRTVNPDGEVKFSYEVARSNNQIFQAGLLLFIILIGAISSVATTAAILSRRRPPSISTLAWLATYLFALIQVRAEFPGNPPLGVNIDRFFTFPVMAIIMALIVANAISWLRRDDWDSENQDYEG